MPNDIIKSSKNKAKVSVKAGCLDYTKIITFTLCVVDIG